MSSDIQNNREIYRPPTPAVREITHADLARIRPILEQWQYDTDGQPLVDDTNDTLAAIAGSIDSDAQRKYLVAEQPDGEVIGIMGLSGEDIDPLLYPPGDRPVELVTAYVSNERRGSGAGTALADTLETMATEMGYTQLIVVSGSRTRTGYPFWTKRYGDPLVQEDYFGKGQERVVWSKKLVKTTT